MPRRILAAAVAVLLGLAPTAVHSQNKTTAPIAPKSKPATLEQRIAELEVQAAKLQKEAQALRDELRATKAPADEDITIYRLKNANAVTLAKLLDELLRGKN